MMQRYRIIEKENMTFTSSAAHLKLHKFIKGINPATGTRQQFSQVQNYST